MYGSDDPRSKLQAAPYGSAASSLRFAAAEYVKFHELPPREAASNARTWYARGQNFVVGYTQAQPGAVLERADQIDEYVLIVPEPGVEVTLSTATETHRIPGCSLVIVPPGKSVVT